MIENKNQLKRAAVPGSGSSDNEGYSVGAGDDSPGVRLAKDNLKLSDNRFVGLFRLLPDGTWEISDIRRTDFSKLILPNGLKINPIPFKPRDITEIQDGAYYEFSWLLKEADEEHYHYVFTVNEAAGIESVSPEGVIQKLHDSISKSSASDGQRTVRMIDTLKSQLTAGGKEIFIYELLQNANDYPHTENGKALPVDVEFHITDSYLLFMHSGAEFNARNIAAICNINDKEKTENSDAIGYKGIGFKTIFIDNDYVYLRTGGYSFRFDRAYSKYRVDTPWQLQPIWTSRDEVDRETDRIFEETKDRFRVQFAIRPSRKETLRSSAHSFVRLFENVFRNERVILFIPHVRSVRVFFNDGWHKNIALTKDSGNWVVKTYSERIPEPLMLSVNAAIEEQENSGTYKIPDKYYNFRKTAVSFACGRDGRHLKKVEDAILYCYLPAKDASWGFDFLMNTDMIPNGPRDDIETDLEINSEISAIAGVKFFDWINDLCRSEEKFFVADIFSLIPDFEACSKGVGKKYSELIGRFQTEFERRLLSEELIPTAAGGYACLKDIIIDETSITLSGMLDERQFLEFSGLHGVLPAKELGGDKNFRKFARRYADELHVFSRKGLHSMTGNEKFRSWLSDQGNNDLFLSFLLDRNLLTDFLNESIFLENENGGLFYAVELFYDADEAMADLSAFSSHISRLSLKTRGKFGGNETWDRYAVPEFMKFDAQSFITFTLLSEENIAETKELLKDWDTSYHFFSYVAKHNIESPDIRTLPFFTDGDSPEPDGSFYADFVFFSSAKGTELFSHAWLSDVDADFVSAHYSRQALRYFRDKLEVMDFDDDIVIEDIILSDDFVKSINVSQQKTDSDSLDFLKYCFLHREKFVPGSLCNYGYALSAEDRAGIASYVLPKEDPVFFPSGLCDSLGGRKWIEDSWVLTLSPFYLKAAESRKDELKSFISSAFIVKDCSPELFHRFVVKKHAADILKKIRGSDEDSRTRNFDFISYLDENCELIKSIDSGLFKKVALFAEDGSEIAPNSWNVYEYDQELESIICSEWFPDGIVHMCSHLYHSPKAIREIGAKEYKFERFFDDIIGQYLQRFINKSINSLGKSVAFHSLVIEHKSDLSPNQLSVMKEASVYLYGRNSPEEKSSGHRIMSPMARELSEKGLLDFSLLDIINPSYKPEEHLDYWKELGNREFSSGDFLSWLAGNRTDFIRRIRDRARNVAFWRWAKKNVPDGMAGRLRDLPVFLKNSGMANACETVYLSDDYIQDGGIETLVSQYQKNARFVSPEYPEAGADKKIIEEWAAFWTKIGVLSEILDILVSSVIPNLKDIKDEKLPATLAHNRKDLENRLGCSLPESLAELWVKGNDGSFRPISDAVYVDCEKEEPFPFISIPEQISAHGSEERKLISEAIEYAGGTYIEHLTDWQAAKIGRYLEVQDDESEKEFFDSIHYRFITELIRIYEDDRTDIDRFLQPDRLKLFGKDGMLHPASELTVGSAFGPTCDFEKYFPSGRQYLSDSYLEQCGREVCSTLQSVLPLHSGFEQGDIKSLSDRKFAVYFWTEYLKVPDNIERVRPWMEEELFNDVPCIPTKDGVRKPSELYSISIESYVKDKVDDWENKLPLESLYKDSEKKEESREIISLFDLLDFREELDFTDALRALPSCTKAPNRRKTVSWMLDQYDEKYSSLIDEYRKDKNAVWLNTSKDEKQISELYALEYKNDMLQQYFSDLPQIVNPDYLPGGNFKDACSMLKIPVITPDDIEVEPEGKKDFGSEKKTLQLYALVIAGSEAPENWKERYASYKAKISGMSLWQCSAISVQYKEDSEICQKLRKFHHSPDTDEFYFVDSIYGNRVFPYFVKSFTEYLGSAAQQDVVEEVMAEGTQHAIEYAKKNKRLMADTEFVSELCRLGGLAPEDGKKLAADRHDGRKEPAEARPHPSSVNPSDVKQKSPEMSSPKPGQAPVSEAPHPAQPDNGVIVPADGNAAPAQEHGETGSRVFSGAAASSDNKGGFTADGIVRQKAGFSGGDNGSVEKPEPPSPDSSDEITAIEHPMPDGTAEKKRVIVAVHSPEEQNGSSGGHDDGSEPFETGYRKRPYRFDRHFGYENVSGHFRSGTWVNGYWRNGYWVNGYYRGDSWVNDYERSGSWGGGYGFGSGGSFGGRGQTGADDIFEKPVGQSEIITDSAAGRTYNGPESPWKDEDRAEKESAEQPEKITGTAKPQTESGSDHDTHQESKTNAENGGAGGGSTVFVPERQPVSYGLMRGKPRTLEVQKPTGDEVDAINRLLGMDLPPKQIAEQNYLVQFRLYDFIQKNKMTPKESKKDFIRDGSKDIKHQLQSGKLLFTCSAYRGIMYLSPAIWNMLASGNCIVVVYYGPEASSFMSFSSTEEILEWINEDAILIKITGKEKSDVVKALYSGILEGVKGTAYTLIPVKQSDGFDPAFETLFGEQTDGQQ